MRTVLTLLISTLCLANLIAQDSQGEINTKVTTSSAQQLARATIQLHRAKDSALLRTSISDDSGRVVLKAVPYDAYFITVSMVNYKTIDGSKFELASPILNYPEIRLEPEATGLEQVTVTAKKPFVQLMPDKTIVNVEAGLTNTGANMLEVLEKSPGITVDRDGNISLKGRQNVLILIDGKQTYLPASEIAQMLEGMSASQIDQLEIMDNPPAKYDAAGNAGVINIRTKKIKQRGFNGNLSSSYGQGHYYKNNNSLALNFRRDNLNLFLTYSSSNNGNFTDLDANRVYYSPGTKNIVSRLNQDGWLAGDIANHTLRAGADISIGKSTSLGFALSGVAINRQGKNTATSTWDDESGATDSLIRTFTNSRNRFRNGGVNLNFKHALSKSKDVSVDVDYLDYDIVGRQNFDNITETPVRYVETLRADLPSSIGIFSGKIDYHQQIDNSSSFDAGYKTSAVRTNNKAEYFLLNNSNWDVDYDKTNYFAYRENIHALYLSGEKRLNAITLQGGVRWEHTSYNAAQTGNPTRKDSIFDRSYHGLFPNLSVQYKADSNNTFALTAGRRLDRPAYQKLNPFVFVINKYTYMSGNPFFQPQYTWNLNATHQFKEYITTTINYSITNNYFSQIFFQDDKGIIYYSEGNLGRMRNIGISVTAQTNVTGWWSMNTLMNLYNKKIEGNAVMPGETQLTQFNMNLGNQFRFSKGWSAELTGFFVTRERELQEITDPTGQIMIGVGKQVLKNKGSLKLTLRDIFYTQAMKGDTDFENAFEYFKLTRDTRVLTIAFSYRFGKSFKSASKRTGASEEMERVGTGA
ncbi:MAG: outer membrane beta-barrel protein [Flavitalea sp.]